MIRRDLKILDDILVDGQFFSVRLEWYGTTAMPDNQPSNSA